MVLVTQNAQIGALIGLVRHGHIIMSYLVPCFCLTWSHFCPMLSELVHNSDSHVSCVCLAGGKTPDQRAVLQHEGPMGNPQEFTQTNTQDWPRPVWRGVGRTVEQHNTCRYQNPQARSVVSVALH